MDFFEFLKNHPHVDVRILADALQCLEEIGGPERADYREVLRALKNEVEIRLENSLLTKEKNV